jgi:rubrerythrin
MYFDRAEELMNICINKLWDDKTGGFFDSEEGLLDINIKAIEDVPHPSANSLAVKVFLKFYSITGRKDYHRYAEMILELFIEQVKLTGIHSGYYFCALNNYFNMLKLTINTAPGSDLARAAIDIYSPFSNIVYGEDKGQVIPCMKDTCFAPVKSPEELISFFKEQKLSHNYHKESEAQLMGDYSVSEVVEQAVQTEKLGYDFYTQISQKFTDNEGLKNLFDTLAVKEQQHEVTFRALKDKVADQKFENWEEAGKYMKSIVESEFFLGNDKSLLSLEHIKSVEDAVKFAIGFEKETLLYFYHLKDALNDKDTIDEIIKEEQSHIVWLSDFRKTL